MSRIEKDVFVTFSCGTLGEILLKSCLNFTSISLRSVTHAGLHPCDHSIVKVNISEKVLYTTAERAKGDTTCEADHTVENLSWKLCVNWQVARSAQPKCVENIISQQAWWHAGDKNMMPEERLRLRLQSQHRPRHLKPKSRN